MNASTTPGRQVWLGRFELQRALDEHADGDVWLARDLQAPLTEVVLKRRRWSTDARLRKVEQRRFELECRVPAQLGHPNVLPVDEHGIAPDAGWQRTRWLPEGEWGHWLRRQTPPGPPAATILGLLSLAADALAHAHAAGIVHRDLKPTNLLLDPGQSGLLVADFGVAHVAGHALTGTHVLIGTPAYMAPELLAGGEPQPPTDAYALGVIAYEALGGRRPHEGASLGALLMAVAREPIPPLRTLRPQLEPAAEALVMALLERAAPHRPPLDRWAAQARAFAATA